MVVWIRRSVPYDRRVGVRDALAGLLTWPDGTRRLVVAFCLAITLGGLAVEYPDVFRDANATARANASLDWVDRQLGAGNSVLPSQSIAVEAMGRIPESDAFTVAVGERRPGWSELAVPYVIDAYMRYFLLPRRARPDAPWILCFACDRADHAGAEPVWEGEDELSILRRR
jgi:hypothetical protein